MNSMANKRANGEGNIRKVQKGNYYYWEARFTVGSDLGTGKQDRKSKYFKTQKEARQFLNSVAVSIDDRTYFEPKKITLSQWLDIWLDEYCKEQKYYTLKHYRSMVDNHIRPKLGAVRLSALTTPQIQKFYNDLAKSGKTVKAADDKGNITTETVPLASKSIRNIHGIFTKALSTAVKIGYIKTNPATNTTIQKAQRKPIHPLTDNQVKQFLESVGEDKYSNLLKVILFTGMRESEAIGLTWDCIDFDKGIIRIEKQLQHRVQSEGGYQFAPLKNDRTRTIKPAPTVMNILKAQRAKQIEERFQAGEIWQGWQNEKERRTALVFLNEEGYHLSPKSLYVHYKGIAKRIGAENTCVHDLRHTYAVLSLQTGDDIKTVQENLGHATASFTLDVYGHVSETMRDESSARMERYISNIKAV